MNWKPFHIEHASTVKILGLNLGLFFGHTPKGDWIWALTVSGKTWAKALQLGG